MAVNSFDSGDVLVKNDSTTLFHTSYKDNCGLSFADNFGEAAAILESTYGEMLKNLEFIHEHFLAISFVTILIEENLPLKSLVIAKVKN